MDLFNLDGKTALVTGSSRGIGRAIALRMAEAGANVVVSSRKIDACEDVVSDIKSNGGNAISVACNVSDSESLESLVKTSRQAFGAVDILVGNAAANPHHGSLTSVKDSAFDKVISTNVKSNLKLCQLLLPDMASRKDGSVIFVTSIAGLRGTADIGIYGLSKAAETSMAQSLAVEWGPHNIRINCIAPGLVKTDFAKALWEDEEKLRAAEAVYPLRRIGEPDDVAGIAVFLASRAGCFVTGQTIVADGGVTIAGSRD